MTTPLEESVAFHRWLKRNDNRLRNYAPDEVAHLALACGFDIPTICPGINSRMETIRRLMSFWESDLSEKWMRVTAIQHGND